MTVVDLLIPAAGIQAGSSVQVVILWLPYRMDGVMGGFIILKINIYEKICISDSNDYDCMFITSNQKNNRLPGRIY